MALSDTRLRILTCPQRWDGSAVSLRILVAPFGNPLQPLDPGLKAFAKAQLTLSAHLIPRDERLPRPADVTERIPAGASTPTDLESLYTRVAEEFEVDPTAPSAYVPPTKTRFLKMVMPSYLEASGFARPRTDLVVTDNRYVCAIADGERPAKQPPKPPVPPKWNAIIAMALRQPLLAERLGLVYKASIAPPSSSFFENGGWIFVTLNTTSDYFAASATPDFLKLYAARIPKLTPGQPVHLFAPVLFPVGAVPPAGSFDDLLRETETYFDGFARLVHTFQPDRADYLDLSRQHERRQRPHTDVGLKLGWDDEQIVIWLNRQLTDDPRNGSLAARDTPLAVRGFRVDVREAVAGAEWASLVRMKGTLQLGASVLGQFDDEMAIELAPAQLQAKRDGEYWLPPYFTQWTGSSLIASDATAFKVANISPKARVLTPVGDRTVPLRYGRTYQFRVRLADLTGGGPDAGAKNEPASAVATSRFRRFVPPDAVRIGKPVENADGSVTFPVRRPMLGYPALVYTPLANAEQRLLDDAATAAAEGRLAGFPDPDVDRVRIDVSVASLEFDPANHPSPEPRRRLFTVFRDFPDDHEEPLDLTLTFQDIEDLALFGAPAAAGPIELPTARTVELELRPIARRDPGMAPGTADPAAADDIDPIDLDRDDAGLVYFGKHAARVGPRQVIVQRRESVGEQGLFDELPGVPYQAIFLQPGSVHDARLRDTNAAAGKQEQAPESPIQKLARQLRLEAHELTLSSGPGRRVVFGASAAVRHMLSPDHSALTFASETEITSQWLIVVALRLARDWTWDALTDEGLRVTRSLDGDPAELVGLISPRKVLSDTAVRRGVAVDRATTDIFFFDAVDPKALPGEFPEERLATYSVVPQFRQAPAGPVADWKETIRLPMAAPPAQVPRIVSAGIALSPYERDERYSKTEPRQRMLWIEFAEPVANPRDAYFARVTMHSADPMLARGEPARPPGPLEPPLNIDPEHIRAIIPDQPEDSSGLDAMQPLLAADGAEPVRHYLLPLPPAVAEASPELFGFFTYEFRVGHAEGWSTARARFGPPQRLTGVQHPVPYLTCSVSRTTQYIRVSAPYATPVADCQVQRAEPPNSELWALLYVQVHLADASDWRNILVGRTKLAFTDAAFRGRSGQTPHGLGYWDQDQVEAWLELFGLPHNSPLSVLALELLPEPGSPFGDPLGSDLGQVRVLRTSPLTPVPAVCVDA
jgi:hypothetical protein